VERNKIKTSIWGPSAWTFLHAISFSFPEDPSPEHKEAVLQLFSSLQLLLPCGDCCSHYCSTFQRKELETHLESRDTFSKWLVEFHNGVNRRLKKPEYPYEKAKDYFLSDDAVCAIQSPCGDDHKQQLKEAERTNSEKPDTTPLHTTSPLWILFSCVGLLVFLLYMFRKTDKVSH
jgi:hypothetical protein